MIFKTRWMMVVAAVMAMGGYWAKAQPLADRIPDKTLVYVGWCGSDNLPATYDKTHLRAILEEGQAKTLCTKLMPALLDRWSLADPESGQIAKIASDAMGLWAKHPTAIFLGTVDVTQNEPPIARVGIVCEAGADADALATLYANKIVAAVGAAAPVKVFRQGELVVLAINYDKEVDVIAAAATSLGASAAFKGAMTQVKSAEPGLVFAYVDGEAAYKIAQAGVAKFGEESVKREFDPLMAALGLNNVRRLAASCSFDGADVCTQLLIDAPLPHTGLVSFLDAAPVPDALLKRIPASATVAMAMRLDFAKAAEQIRVGFRKISPQHDVEIPRALKEFTDYTKLDLQKDILEPMGDQWALYLDPQSNGPGMLGLTVVNRPAKPAEFKKALETLEGVANEAIVKEMADPKGPVLGFATHAVAPGLELHTFSLPGIAPTWTLHDDALIVGLYQQSVISATRDRAAGAPSILDNPTFLAWRKRLGNDKLNLIEFVDLSKTGPRSYANVLVLSQLLTGMGDLFGAQSTPMLLPPLPKMRPHLTAAIGGSWTDDAGAWHYKAIEPFPLSGLFVNEDSLFSSNLFQAMSLLGSRAQARPAAIMMEPAREAVPPPPAKDPGL